MNSLIILRNGRVIDPARGVDAIEDVWISSGKIVASGSVTSDGARIIDLGGKWIVPGLIDMHVHLREPGEEYKETIASGTRAAAVGGFTGVACMPNTNPVNDNASVTAFILDKARECDARVYPVGAQSVGLLGEKLAGYGEMLAAGVVAVSDDGNSIDNSQLMRRSMEYAASFGLTVISHPEDKALGRNGCMNEGYLATSMGLKGIPAEAESIMVERDIALAGLTGAKLHLAHISTRKSVEKIRSAKEQGIAVTAETAPHYFTLTEDAVKGYNTNAKMNPPLRSEDDRLAVMEGLKDGTLDVIATDHAPHSILEKEIEFNYAAHGIVGLESALPLSLRLVEANILTPFQFVAALSCHPAKILGVEGGSLQEGRNADITVIDPDHEYVFDPEKCVSKGKNTPFGGMPMKGRAVMTFVGGVIRHNHLVETDRK